MSLVPVGRIVRAHGVRGEVRVKLYNETSTILRSGGRAMLSQASGDATLVKLGPVRRVQGGLVLRIEGCEDRDQAERLRSAELSVEAAELPELRDGSVYVHQLMGCTVVDEDSGAELGCVGGVDDFGAHALLRVEHGGRTWLLPFVDEYVRAVELTEQRLSVAGVAELIALASE